VITLSCHQPAYLPWLGYFNKMARADIFVSLGDVQFERGSYVNRNKIKDANGIVWLTIPLKMRWHMKKTIRQMEPISDTRWRQKHKKTILQSYAKSAYSWEYRYILSGIFSGMGWLESWQPIAQLLKIETPVYKGAKDLPGITGQNNDLLISMCKHFKADRFIFGEQGRGYCDMAAFVAAGIEPLFQNFQCLEYPQIWGEFEPQLSVIDALMNVGAKRTRELIMEGWKP